MENPTPGADVHCIGVRTDSRPGLAVHEPGTRVHHRMIALFSSRLGCLGSVLVSLLLTALLILVLTTL
ncbi:MAG: hypothetical protein ACRDRK_10250 [Pseudonocardia sp.]